MRPGGTGRVTTDKLRGARNTVAQVNITVEVGIGSHHVSGARYEHDIATVVADLR